MPALRVQKTREVHSNQFACAFLKELESELVRKAAKRTNGTSLSALPYLTYARLYVGHSPGHKGH